MPDVGVLNLQIQDNSAQAAKGLDDLATALGRVKAAVGGGLKLGGVANQISKLNEALQKAIPEQSLANLERFAAAVEKINAAGGIKLSGLKNMGTFDATGTSAEKIREQVEEAAGASLEYLKRNIQETSEQIEGMNGKMEAFNQLVQQTAWTAGNMAEHFSQMFSMWNEMRMASSLGGGKQMRLGDGATSSETGWSYYNPWGNVDETKWTAWKDGAIEAEYTISDAADTTFDHIDQRIEGSRQLLLGAGETATQEVEEVAQAVQEFIGYKRVWNENSREWQTVGYTQEDWDARLEYAQAMQEIMNQSMNNSGTNSELEETGSFVDRLRERFQELLGTMRRVSSEGASAVRSGFSTIQSGVSNLLSPITSLWKQLYRIAKYRMFRAVIKQISSAFSEGVENYYRYSQAIGSSFAPAMDSAASSLQQMKNSIGAAVAPLIQSLIPYLQILVNWFISLVNYANQFIALMRGQSTWSRATTQSATAFDKVKTSATGASAAVKDLLADWDELNIIQSETTSSGSGNGTNGMTDALSMFEEVSTFSNKIKAIVDYIKDNFETIKALALGVAAALLAWKLSPAFANFMSTLATWIAGGVLIAVGLKLGWDGAYSMGSSGFSWGSMFETIAGFVASGLGGYIIGGGFGAVAALGVNLALDLVAYLEGTLDNADKLRWGETSLTPEDVKTYVDGLFSFDVNARINLFDTVIENQSTARRKLNTAISEFSKSLGNVKIGVDGTPKGIQDAADRARDVITQINENLKNSEENLEIITKITPITSENGEEDITGEFLSDVKIADAKLSEYFTNMGKEIAKWIDEGEKTGWKNNEAEMALELMRHQQSILDQAEGNKISRNFQVESELNISSMTRDTAQQVLEEEKQRIEDYTSKVKEMYENQAKELYYYADLADAAGLVDEEGNPLSDAYVAMAEELIEKIKSGEIYNEIAPDIETLKQQWQEQLQKIYGEAFDVGSMTQLTDVFRNFFGAGSYFEEEVGNAFQDGGAEKAAAIIRQKLEQVLDVLDPQGIVKDSLGTFGINIFDIIDFEGQKTLIDAIYNSVHGDNGAAIAILNAMGISNDTIAKALSKETDDALAEATMNANLPAQIIQEMNDADWQHMADEEFNGMIAALRDKFGGDAVRNALSELDIPLSDITVPLDVTVQETIEPEVESGVDPALTILGIEVPTQNMELPDAHMKVIVDTEEEGDLHIEDLLEPGANTTGRKIITTSNLIASAGASTNGLGRGRGNTGGEQEQISITFDQSEQKGNIRDGVIGGTNDILTALRSILTVANALNNKQWTINVNPSSGWGGMNAKSAGMRERVSGDYIPGGMG